MLQLVKFSDLSSLLDLKKESLDDYPALKLLISSVYSAIESYTGRWLEAATYTELIQIDGKLINLSALPITSITSVDIDDEEVDVTTIKIGKYDIALPLNKSGLAKVVYVGGYEDPTAELTRAALLQIAHEYQRKDQIGATLSTTDGGSVTWPELTLLTEVKRILGPYVNPNRLI